MRRRKWLDPLSDEERDSIDWDKLDTEFFANPCCLFEPKDFARCYERDERRGVFLRGLQERLDAERRRLNPQKTKNAAMLALQDAWIETGDRKAWERLWLMCGETAAKCIRKNCREKRLWIDSEAVSEFSIAACEYVLRRIADRSGEYRVANFSAAMRFGVQHAMFYRSYASKAEKLLKAVGGGRDAVEDALARLGARDGAKMRAWVATRSSRRMPSGFPARIDE